MYRFFLLLLLLFPYISLAETTYALIIGINNYDDSNKFSNLKGAINDANLIYTSLKDIGIPPENLIKLIDKQATKKEIIASWEKLIKKSKQDDTLVFSFAGHGTQEIDQNGDEKLIDPEDNYDETLLLSAYAETSKETQNERLVDDEIYLLLKKAKGRKIIYLVDSCHSGGTPRGVDPRVPLSSWRSRAAPPSRILLSKPSLLEQTKYEAFSELDLDSFYQFAATESRKYSVEGIINGKPQGALSWAFSQALKEAQLHNKSTLSFSEMANYISTSVKNITESRQFADILTKENKNTVLFRFENNKIKKTLVSMNFKKLKVAILGRKPKWFESYTNLEINTIDPDFIWDANNGDILNKLGDITAYNIKEEMQFNKVINRYRLIQSIDKMTVFHFIESHLSSFGDKNINKNSKLHHFSNCTNCKKCNDRCIVFNISNLKYHFLYQFNITGNGLIQCFSSERVKNRKQYEFNASPPAGNDTLVTIVINKPSEKLQQLIGSESECSTATELIQKLPSLLNERIYQMGRIDTFTGN